MLLFAVSVYLDQAYVDREQLNAQDRMLGVNTSSGSNTSQKAERIPIFRPLLRLGGESDFQFNLVRARCMAATQCTSQYLLRYVLLSSISTDFPEQCLRRTQRDGRMSTGDKPP